MKKEKMITVCRCSKESEISEIHTIVKYLKPKLDTLNDDLIEIKGQISYYQGSISTWKFVAGSGGILALFSMALTIIFHFV